jgi:hypothetical protein
MIAEDAQPATKKCTRPRAQTHPGSKISKDVSRNIGIQVWLHANTIQVDDSAGWPGRHDLLQTMAPPLLGNGKGRYRVHIVGNSGKVILVTARLVTYTWAKIGTGKVVMPSSVRICWPMSHAHRPRPALRWLLCSAYRTFLSMSCTGNRAGKRRLAKNFRPGYDRSLIKTPGGGL